MEGLLKNSWPILINRIRKMDRALLLSLFIFSSLYLPFIDSIPVRDGGVELDYAYSFYLGGFPKLFSDFGSVHPPLKPWLVNAMFFLFGHSVFVHNSIGFIFGIIGILSIYYLALKILDKKTASISALLLSCSPIFLSVDIFSLAGYLITVLFLTSVCLYAYNNLIGYAFSSSLLVLSKEYALILPLSVIVVELFYIVFNNKRGKEKVDLIRCLKKFIPFTIPFLVAFAWYLFLKLNSVRPWQDYIFTDSPEKGSFYTVIENLLTLRIFNEYAYQNWSQLFFLNFNWIYWIFTIAGIALAFSSAKTRKSAFLKIKSGGIKIRTMVIMFLSFLVHLVCVLSFQTWTIPRYALVLYPMLIISFSFSIKKITSRLPSFSILIYSLVSAVVVVSLFFSVDPISISFWGTMTESGQTLYNLPVHHGGPDGMTYNVQYLLICKKRTQDVFNPKEGTCIDPWWIPLSIDFLEIDIDKNRLCRQW